MKVFSLRKNNFISNQNFNPFRRVISESDRVDNIFRDDRKANEMVKS